MRRRTRLTALAAMLAMAASIAVARGVAAGPQTDAGSEAKAEPANGVRVEFRDDRKVERTVDGRIVVEALDGGLLLMGRDGRLWNVTPDRLIRREATGEPFRPFSPEETVDALKTELGPGFEIVRTRHYVIASQAGARYGQWCGALFERLYDAFHTLWKTRPLELAEPEFPLVAVVLADETAFAEFAARDVGPAAAAGAKGYFSLQSNRMVLYDLTAQPGMAPAKTLDEIQRKIGQNPFNVATIVHEATHQIAFNSGLQTRQADHPLWLTEGMAIYFETPDLSNRSGWRTVGKVNDGRLRRFRDYVQRRRKPGSLETLLATDARFTDVETAEDAYAEAWVLTHFLIRTRRKGYVDYLAGQSAKRPLVWDGGPRRLEEFRGAFGEIDQVERDFLKYAERLGR